VIKILAGLILGLIIGSACRWFDIPLPGPPKLVGALLIVSITCGYLATDKLITTKFSSKGPALTRDMCGGPNGEVITKRIAPSL
jgi:XapX domain-containing protein